ncbi:Transcriptional regulator [Microbotryomycetes sp. JL221]|nr:Transcriptional regulator [Microbotryomycetes sp. JL221]
MPNTPGPAVPSSTTTVSATANGGNASTTTAAAVSPLRKFVLHSPAIIGSASPIVAAANHAGPYPIPMLMAARQALVNARQSAAERHPIRDSNRKNLLDRQSNEKRLAEEQAKQKEVERKRKRDEDEKKERERVDRIERERADREREETARKKREEEAYQKQVRQAEEEKRLQDERERQETLQRAREAKEKKRLDDEARANEEQLAKGRQRSAEAAAEPAQSSAGGTTSGTNLLTESASTDTTATAAAPSDVKMEDLPSSSIQHSSQQQDTAPTEAPPSSASAAAANLVMPSIEFDAALEADEDEDQVRVPLRHEKKRKRDHVIDSDDGSDSDDQPLLAKARKLDATNANGLPSASPAPTVNGGSRSASLGAPTQASPKKATNSSVPEMTPIEKKLKEEKFVKHSIPIKPPAPGTATAFYLPSHSLVPPKLESIPPEPTAKRQADVTGDFSVAKPGTQIAHHTFHTWVEAYLRPFGEDDLAFLAPKSHDVAPYLIPPLGKHYTEVWEEEDSGMTVGSTSAYASPLEPAPLTRTRPEHLTEEASGAENVSLGPLSERLVAALAFNQPGQDDEDSGEGGSGSDDARSRPNGVNGIHTGNHDETNAMVDRSTNLDAVELEDRIKRELKFIGLLPEDEVDWSLREDDEISSALRACQRQLYHQTTLNESRKAVLSSIVKDRMAYQDFEQARDAQERIIENGWSKRQKSENKKKKSKREKERERRQHGAGADEPTSSLITGKHMSLSLLEAMDRRNRLIGSLKPFFEDDEEQGRFYGLPERSVFEGLEEAILAKEDEDEAFNLV